MTHALLPMILVSAAAAPTPDPTVMTVDVGSESDGPFIVRGFSNREGFNPKSRSEYYRTCTFRWASNNFSVKLPVFSDQANEVTLRTNMGRRRLQFSAGQWEAVVRGSGEPCVVGFSIPKSVVGSRDHLPVSCTALDPYRAGPNTRDRRELAAAIDWFRVKPRSPSTSSKSISGCPATREPCSRASTVVKGLTPRPSSSWPGA